MASPYVNGVNETNGTHETHETNETANELPLPSPPTTWDPDAHLPQLARDSLHATEAHLVHALDHVGGLLSARGYRWALTGALALVMHGYEGRETADVDLVVEAAAGDVLIALTDAGIYRPPTISLTSGVRAVFFVLTGPECGDMGVDMAVEERRVVEVGLMLPGLSVPATLSGATTVVTADTCAGPRTYRVLTVPRLFRAKLHALGQRDAEYDLSDLEWLCLNFGPEIEAVTAAGMFGEHELMGCVTKYRERRVGRLEQAVRGLMALLGLEGGLFTYLSRSYG